MKRSSLCSALLFTLPFICSSYLVSGQTSHNSFHKIHALSFQQVKINDPFWSPKYQTWNKKTVYDVFDKLEGKYEPDRADIIAEKVKWGRTRNAFLNFDVVAAGKTNTQQHDGPPWYDGLVYESIRGEADLLAENPDAALESKIDAYIDRIAAAQDADPDGYLNTYTTQMKPGQRWGTNGGDDKWQHDVYNAGMLMEAAVHYYKAAGKTKLLNVAVKFSNFICSQMGPSPKFNVVPGHGGPEEALLKLYQLFKDEPALRNKISAPVKEEEYFSMVKFWIEQRGNYGEKDGTHSRKSDGAYNQDHMPVFQQQTIEGHAVRATLLAVGITAVALETNNEAYRKTAGSYWDNMIGKRMFITGGEGAISDGERFGADYFLPESAYLETCAAIGAGFFSEQMNELEADGKYIDEFERVIYNNMLSGISLNGDQYFYENPLTGNGNKRWNWHDCPCCPPMILKIIGAIPQYIYGQNENDVYVNLFIGSEANISLHNGNISLVQTTGYPWKGNINLTINSSTSPSASIYIRVPGWATGMENPYGLYHSNMKIDVALKLNGKKIPLQIKNGYAVINRKWQKGDVVELTLPMAPRLISANDAVQNVKSKLAIASGPVVYSLEAIDNPGLKDLHIDTSSALVMSYQPKLLNGVNVIKGKAINAEGESTNFTAIPFFAIGNREAGAAYKVWIPKTNAQHP